MLFATLCRYLFFGELKLELKTLEFELLHCLVMAIFELQDVALKLFTTELCLDAAPPFFVVAGETKGAAGDNREATMNMVPIA